MKKSLLPLFVMLAIALTVSAQKKSSRTKPTIAVADSLFLNQQWSDAIATYEKVLKKEEGSALSWNRLAFSYHNLGKLDKAIELYEKSLTLKPAAPLELIIESRLAKIYASRSENDKAFAALNRAADIGYSNLAELDTSRELASLKSDSRFGDVRKKVFYTVYPCEGNEKARQFDFWIGEWDAYVRGTNTLAGVSRIEKASGGCMILENWTSKGGPFEGKSINFVDPKTGTWKQVWVGSGSYPNVSEFLNGEYRDGAMRFEFESTDAQGKNILTHFHFYNESPDQVRQMHQTSNDGGQTWTTTYDFTYKRRK